MPHCITQNGSTKWETICYFFILIRELLYESTILLIGKLLAKKKSLKHHHSLVWSCTHSPWELEAGLAGVCAHPQHTGSKRDPWITGDLWWSPPTSAKGKISPPGTDVQMASFTLVRGGNSTNAHWCMSGQNCGWVTTVTFLPCKGGRSYRVDSCNTLSYEGAMHKGPAWCSHMTHRRVSICTIRRSRDRPSPAQAVVARAGKWADAAERTLHFLLSDSCFRARWWLQGVVY